MKQVSQVCPLLAGLSLLLWLLSDPSSVQRAKSLWKSCALLEACEREALLGEAAAVLSLSSAASLCALSPHPAICLLFPLPPEKPGGSSQSPQTKQTPTWRMTCWSLPYKRFPVALGRKKHPPHLPHKREERTLCHKQCAPTWQMTLPHASSFQSLRAASHGADERRAVSSPFCKPCRWGDAVSSLAGPLEAFLNVGTWVPGVFHIQFWVLAASRTGQSPTQHPGMLVQGFSFQERSSWIYI